MNSAPSHDVEPQERLAEIGSLLAATVIRLRARKSSRFPAEFGESSLHISPLQSGHMSPCTAEVP
jgi:hypothetical protein